MSNRNESSVLDETAISKYKLCGTQVNNILKIIIQKCVAGATVRTICIEGDNLIEEKLKTIFKKDKEIKRGIAFPMCLSVNNCINHFSPLTLDNDIVLKDGDMVKIDFGAHIDEFICVVAHTIIVGATKENKVTGRKADVMLAAHYAAEASLRLMKPGNQNYSVTDAVIKAAESYGCKPIEGMLSFQLEQGLIDGEKTIIQNPTEAQRKEIEKCDFKVNEVYGVDVIVSTGDGIGREMDTKTTVYKKTEENYSLKLRTSREFYTKVQKEYGNMPFTIRSFDDEKKARLGVVECVTHRLVEAYPVMYEKPAELVAQFKFTVLLLADGTQRVCGFPLERDGFQSKHSIQDEGLKKLLNTSVSNKKKQQPSKKSSDKAKTDGNKTSKSKDKKTTESKDAPPTPGATDKKTTPTKPSSTPAAKQTTPTKTDNVKQTTPTKTPKPDAKVTPTKPKTPEKQTTPAKSETEAKKASPVKPSS